jgi:O-antigen/teichoic acid export membrane protein
VNSENKAYSGILKATSIFGGVQVFQIIVQLVKSKVVAVLLGPSGMGVLGLITSTLTLVISMTNLGLGTSAIKNVAESNLDKDSNKLSVTIYVLRKLVWITGLIGAVLMLVFSKQLSVFTFNSEEYFYSFMLLSTVLILSQLAVGERVVLQGMRRLKDLALANIYGSALGLMFAIPIYYYFGVKGIVPVIIISAFFTLLILWLYARKISIPKVNVPTKAFFLESKEMLKMGISISMSGLFVAVSSYLLRIYIADIGSVEQVGLYTAGFAIVSTYFGLVFSAMGTDFYPRLAAVAKEKASYLKVINQQAEIALLILGPILIAFIVFIKIVTLIVYSEEFIGITDMVVWASFGTFFKAGSWCIAFLFLAKSESKLFFWNELISNIYVLGLNVLGYKLGGLQGLGISFMVAYFIYLIQVYFIANYKYSFNYNRDFFLILGVHLSLAIIVLMGYLVLDTNYILGSVITIISIWFSLHQLDKRMSIMEKIKQVLKK